MTYPYPKISNNSFTFALLAYKAHFQFTVSCHLGSSLPHVATSLMVVHHQGYGAGVGPSRLRITPSCLLMELGWVWCVGPLTWSSNLTVRVGMSFLSRITGFVTGGITPTGPPLRSECPTLGSSAPKWSFNSTLGGATTSLVADFPPRNPSNHLGSQSIGNAFVQV
jgi:hypothetical protein